MRRNSFLFLLIFILLPFSCNPSSQEIIRIPQTEAERHMPEFALGGLEQAPGISAQLFASEPEVRNPTNMDIDHRGRVWIVENINYRPWHNKDNVFVEEGDQIIILEDTDQDGKADKRSIFLQDPIVDAALGICVLDNKVILSNSPYILMITDEDRDDKADRIDTLFTKVGSEQNDHAVHAVSFGPDGRLYFNFGNAGRQIHDREGNPIKDPFGRIINDSGNPYRHGMVLRCELDGSHVEVLGHNFRNNYEVAVDSYGTLWQSDNDDDGNKSVRINYVMEYGNFGYRDELTGDAWQTPRTNMHPNIPDRHWHQNDPGVVPNLLITGSGSPAGITVYEGDLLPERFQGQLIHAEAGPGAVRAYPTEKSGAGYTAHIENILTRSLDDWYRPSDVSVAPDGSLFACDWYDPGVGANLATDNLSGRVFRISAKGGKYACKSSSFDTPSAASEALRSPNLATRYLAWTALRGFGKEAEAPLLKLWKGQNPRHRARALWLLGRIDDQHIQNALKDEDPNLRMTAIRASRQLLPDQLEAILWQMKDDPAPEVRREVAIALREVYSPKTSEIWASLANQYDGKDRWYLEALGIGAMDHWEEYFQAWLELVGEEWNTPWGRDIIWRARAPKAFGYLMRGLSDVGLTASDHAPFLRATDFHNVPNKDKRLAALLHLDREDQQAFQQMLLTHISTDYAKSSPAVMEVVREIVPDLRGTAEYLDLLTQLNLQEESEHLLPMIVTHPDHELGVRAANLLIGWEQWQLIEKSLKGEQKDALIAVFRHTWNDKIHALLRRIISNPKEDMASRKQAVRSLGWGWAWEERLEEVLQEEDLSEEVKTEAANLLITAPRAYFRELAMSHLQQGEAQEFATLQDLSTRNGDAVQGQAHFKTYCSSCHQVNGEGIDFGPALSEIANKLGKDAMYSAILYPSAGISHGFDGYVIKTHSGSTFTGYILSEDGSKIDLRMMGGVTQSIPTGDIVSNEPLSISLMTANLHIAMGEEALVDLVEYLATLRNEGTLEENPFQGKVGFERE